MASTSGRNFQPGFPFPLESLGVGEVFGLDLVMRLLSKASPTICLRWRDGEATWIKAFSGGSVVRGAAMASRHQASGHCINRDETGESPVVQASYSRGFSKGFGSSAEVSRRECLPPRARRFPAVPEGIGRRPGGMSLRLAVPSGVGRAICVGFSG